MKTRIVVALVMLIGIVRAVEAQGVSQEEVAQTLRAHTAAIVTPLSCSDAPLLTCGSSKLGSLGTCLSSPYYIDLYTFSATAGQTIALQATTTSTTQIFAAIENSSGTVVASNYGSFVANVSYTFPSAGIYYFGVSLLAQFATSTYTIGVTCGSSQSLCTTSGTIGLNSSISSQLSAANGTACLIGTDYYSVRYAFPGVQDTPLKLSVLSSFGAYVEVSATDGSFGVFSQNSQPGTINITYLPAYTGMNYIFVSSYAVKATGSYTVALAPLVIDPCRKRAVSH